jgi:two-component system OmpR family response regulator
MPQNKVVLVVEDDSFTRRQIATLLTIHGHRGYIAENVADGMHLLSEGPTHVLLDLDLPDGSGNAILRHVRSTGMETKVAVVSGCKNKDVLTEMVSLRPDAVFEKPTTEAALMAFIEAV